MKKSALHSLLIMAMLLAVAPQALLAAAASATASPAHHAASAASAAPQVPASAAPQVPRFRFENFTTANGLPDNHVYSVLVDGDRIWAGTDNGLGLYENGKWKVYTTKDGLAHRA